MKKVKLIGALTGVVLSLIVILQNTQPVETRFLFLRITMPNAILLGLTLLVGVAIGILMTLILSNKRNEPRNREPNPAFAGYPQPGSIAA